MTARQVPSSSTSKSSDHPNCSPGCGVGEYSLKSTGLFSGALGGPKGTHWEVAPSRRYTKTEPEAFPCDHNRPRSSSSGAPRLGVWALIAMSALGYLFYLSSFIGPGQVAALKPPCSSLFPARSPSPHPRQFPGPLQPQFWRRRTRARPSSLCFLRKRPLCGRGTTPSLRNRGRCCVL